MFSVAQQYSLDILDTTDQITDIYNAIINVSNQSRVDARVILAVIIEEVISQTLLPHLLY